MHNPDMFFNLVRTFPGAAALAAAVAAASCGDGPPSGAEYSQNPQADFEKNAVTNVRVLGDRAAFTLKSPLFRCVRGSGENAEEILARTSFTVEFEKTDHSSGVDGYIVTEKAVTTEYFNPENMERLGSETTHIKGAPYGIRAKGGRTAVISPYGQIVRSQISAFGANVYTGTKYDFDTNEFVYGCYAALAGEDGEILKLAETNYEDAAVKPDISGIRPEDFKRGKIVYFRWRPEGVVNKETLKSFRKGLREEFEKAKAK